MKKVRRLLALATVGCAILTTPSTNAAIQRVSNTTDSGPGSLRQAIGAANQNPGPDTIVFNIPTNDPGFDGNVFTIRPLSALPALTDTNTTIDGATQTAFTGDTNPAGPEVVLNGSQVAFVGGGLAINSSGNIINGLVLNGFNNTGIDINGVGATSNTVTGCYLGTNPTGNSAVPNASDGIAIRGGASNNTIGGSSPAGHNLISGNVRNGITIQDITVGSAVNNNVVQGNFIGTNATGQSALGNGQQGIQIGPAASGNLVGGTTPGARNIISGNGNDGVALSQGDDIVNNRIQGNFIGTDVSGTFSLGNRDGVGLFSTSPNTIGGTTAGMQNVISGNSSSGIVCSRCSNQVIQGNLIGTNAAGSAAIPNGGGLVVDQGAQNNTIGGTVAGAQNVIAGNTGNGVTILASGTNGNTILFNSIYLNGGLGIDLGGDGVTPNDQCDGDSGPNNLQNFPVLTSANSSGGNTTIVGTLNSTSGTPFRIDFFSSTACDPSGNGEGQTFIGFTTITTPAGACDASINAVFPVAVSAGNVITATATDPTNNTSEFSACLAVTGPTPTPTPTPPPARPVITSPLNATRTVGQPFVYQFIASGATLLDVANLPPGLTFLSPLSAIVGNPTAAGVFQVRLSASNTGGTTTATLVINVQPSPPAGPIIASSTAATGRVGQPFIFRVYSTGGTPAARLSASGLPPGLVIDAVPGVTGLISGRPTAEGSSAVTLTVTDGPFTTTSTLQLTFTADPALPVIISPSSASLTPGQFFSYTIIAPSSDPGDPARFSYFGNLPGGLTFNAATGTISGTLNPLLPESARVGRPPKLATGRARPIGGPDLAGGALLGSIQLFATNGHGTSTLPLAFLRPSPGVVNISTRLRVETGDNVLIGGFIIQGNAPEVVVIRAIGPSLTGIPGALQDPVLELHDSAHPNIVISNDNWKDSQQDLINATTIPPTDNRESGIVIGLDPGNYTAIVAGKNTTTGIALVEVYDLGTASLDISGLARLANISTRGFVDTGDNAMIGGFIIRGQATRVIARAIGPSLTQFGIANALANPTLELRDGNGALRVANNDWQDDPAQAAELTAAGLALTNQLESGIAATLPVGPYTALVRGNPDTTIGVALVEVYALP